MYLCNCNGLTVTQIEEAIEAGVDKPHETLEHHGCVPRCCGCLNRIGRMIKENQDNDDKQPSCGIVAQARANITTSEIPTRNRN